MNAIFLHIPKTGGVSIQAALGLQQYRNRRALVKGQQYEGLVTFGHELLPLLRRRGLLMGNWYTFTFCRNPYDRAVSLWAYYRQTKELVDFADFCRNLAEYDWRIRSPQTRWVDGVDLDFLGRFENLDRDVDRLCDALGVERRVLPRLNDSKRPACRDCYNTETAEMVRSWYKSDFERFGYADNYLPD